MLRYPRSPRVIICLLFALLIFNLQFKSSAATTFTVTNAQDSGPGSLRQAILDANANPGADVINFSIGSFRQTIVLASALPVITDPVTIDATTQPGFAGTPLIEVQPDRTLVFDGFKITGGNSVLRGLVINRFRGHGIILETGGGNVIEGNYIGTEVTGTVGEGNFSNGVFILSSSNNRIGGLTAAARNVISGNFQNGVHMALGASNNVVQGNYIGVSAHGSFAVPNFNHGVLIFNNAPNNTIGGTTASARNVISGNSGDGISIDSSNGTVIQGNFIGTNAQGDAAIDSTGTDLRVASSSNTLIGGSTTAPGTAPGNVIASMFIVGGVQTRVQGNLVGTNAAGTAQLQFATLGIAMWGDMLLGGSTPDLRNVISGFGTAVLVANSGGGSILGNYIGTDITGTTAIGNSTGVDVVSNFPTQIGGPNAGEGNVISGNAVGIKLEFNSAIVKGNFIGTRKDGTTALPNQRGINIGDHTSENVIGGTEPGAANTIAFNSDSGISLAPPSGFSPAAKNRIRGNRIHSNGVLGIDLNADGVTLNDAGDADSGANGLQNFPNLTSVTTGASSTIEGNLNSTAGSSFTVDFYLSNACDASGFGQGASFVGSTQTNTDANGNASFSAQFPISFPTGSVITATATDAVGNTSEFSLCRVVNAPGTVQLMNAFYSVQEQGGVATITVSRTFGTVDGGSVHYATSNGTATAGSDFTTTSGTLTFGPGETIKSFTVPIINDVTDENSETVNLTLSNPTGFTLGARNTAVLNIGDNDPAPSVSISDATVGEGDGDFTDIQFQLNLSAISGKTVSVRYNTFGISAMAGFDFEAQFSRTVTFNPGETSKTITIRVICDTTAEPNETFQVSLNLPTNVTIADNSGIGTIIDDDALLLLTEEGSQRALSLDSVLFVRDPFAVVNTNNFSSDQRTRIILLSTGLKLAAGEDATDVVATAEDPQLGVHTLPVEFVGPVPSFPWLTQVVVRLPDSLANKTSALVSITVHGVTSNKVLVTLKSP